jgi:hypothetical protein
MKSRGHDCLRRRGPARRFILDPGAALPARSPDESGWAAVPGFFPSPMGPPLSSFALRESCSRKAPRVLPKSAVRAACGNPSPLRPGVLIDPR